MNNISDDTEAYYDTKEIQFLLLRQLVSEIDSKSNKTLIRNRMLIDFNRQIDILDVLFVVVVVVRSIRCRVFYGNR